MQNSQQKVKVLLSFKKGIYNKQAFIYMGQNSSDIIESRSIYIHNWVPLEHQPNAFINKVTLEQVQRHSLHLSTNHISQETSVYKGRINNHQPYICRLLYFHPVSSDYHKITKEKTERQYYFYTDKLFPIKQWTYDNIIMILHGFRKLISLYGPIQITQKLIAQNSNGQIKVWISGNAISNQPQRRYPSEEDTAKDLINILSIKNYSIATIFQHSASLRQIIEKLNKQRRDSGNSASYGSSNYTLKHFQSQNCLKNKERIFSNNSYKNPFIQPSDSNRQKPQTSITLTPTPIAVKSYEKIPYTPFNKKKAEQIKPTSNLAHNLDYNKQNGRQKDKINKTHEQSNNTSIIIKSKSSNQMHIQFSKYKEHHAAPSFNSSLIKKESSEENQASQLQIKPLDTQKSNQTHLSTSPSKPYHFKPKMEYKYGFNPSFSSLIQKNKPLVEGVKKQQAKIYQQKSFDEASHYRQTYKLPQNKKKQSEQQKNYIGQNITIINNNVNNYINNITHNHIVKIEKNPQPIQFNQFKSTNHANLAQNNTPSSSNPPSNNSSQISKGFKDRPYVPGFISHKKNEGSSVLEESPPNIKPKSFFQAHTNDVRYQHPKVNSPNFHHTINSPNYHHTINSQGFIHTATSPVFNKSFKKLEPNQMAGESNCFDKNLEKPKLYFKPKNFHKDTKTDKFEYKDYRPHSPQANSICQNANFSSFHNNFNGGVNDLFITPLRTKTTQFYQRNRDQRKTQFGKIFTKDEIQSKQQSKAYIFEKLDVTAQIPIYESTSKQYKKQQIRAEMKNVLLGGGFGEPNIADSKKKLNSQLKNEFKLLLSDSNATESPQNNNNKSSMKKSQSLIIKQTKQVKQVVEVKDKIKKKQVIFAELKKQANTLLN